LTLLTSDQVGDPYYPQTPIFDRFFPTKNAQYGKFAPEVRFFRSHHLRQYHIRQTSAQLGLLYAHTPRQCHHTGLVSLALGGYEAHGFLAGSRVSGVDTTYGAGNGHAPWLLYAPHRHAQMFGLHDEDGAAGA
jgi:hypothetical protein